MASPNDRVTVANGPYRRMEAELLAPEGDGWRVRIVFFGHAVDAVLSNVDLGLAAPRPPSITLREIEPPMRFERLLDAPDTLFDPPGAVVTRPGSALRLKSGRILGFDPTGFFDDYAPYERSVAPGLYPTSISIDVATNRVLAATIRFASRPVVRWRVAGVAAEEHVRIAGTFNREVEEPYEYECPRLGGLCDADAFGWIRKHTDALRTAVDEAIRDESSWPDPLVRVGGGDEAAVELLMLMAHDGHPCRSWWGEDEDGNAVALVSDLYSRGSHRAKRK